MQSSIGKHKYGGGNDKKLILLRAKFQNKGLLAKILSAFVGQGVGIGFQFVFIIVAGRILEESVYGQIIYVYTFLSLVMILTKFGLENGMVSLMARGDIDIEEKRWSVLFCLKVATVLSILAIVFLFIAEPGVKLLMGNGKGNYHLLKVMSPIILLETWAMIIASVIRGFKRITAYYIIYMHIQYGARVVIFLILYYLVGMEGLKAIVASYYCSYVAMVIYGHFCLREIHLFSGMKAKFPVTIILGLTVPMLLSNAIDVVNAQIDQYMIGYMMDDSKKLAVYSVALNIGKVSSFALVAVNSIFAPMISEYYYGGKFQELERLYSLLTKWVVVFNALATGFISICAEDVLMIAGSKYIEGKTVLLIIFIGQLANSLVGAVGFLNSMTGRPQYVMYAAVSGICVNILLNKILIPILGINGAAIATASALTVDIIVNFVLMYRYLHIQPYNYKYICIVPSFVAAFVPTYLLHVVINTNFILKIVVCGGVYTFIYSLCTYMFVFSSEERVHVKKKFSKNKDK